MGGFCEKLLPSDRWGWSDVSGLQPRQLDRVALPSPYWEWESDWYVDENFGGEPTEKGVGERAPIVAVWGDALGSTVPTKSSVPAIPNLAGPSYILSPLLCSASPTARRPSPCPDLKNTSFQGWTYAIDFPATYTRDQKWNSCVRRRRWIRYRRYKARDTWAKVWGLWE